MPGWIVGQLLHLCLLLFPTLLLSLHAVRSPAVLFFAVGILVAGILESCLAPAEQWHLRNHDRLAIQVARFVGMLLLGLFWLAQLERLVDSRNYPLGMHVTGAMLMAGGIALRGAAIRSLGRRFVSDIRVEQIVTAGIYRWMRHPGELGMLCIGVGGPLLLGAPGTALLAGGSMLPLCLWRVCRENRLLSRSVLTG